MRLLTLPKKGASFAPALKMLNNHDKERTTKMNKIKYITCDREAGNVITEVTDCGVGDIIIRGLGERERVMHLAEVTWQTRTIEGMADVKADYYVASYSVEVGDGDVDQWQFYTADGRRLTSEEA